jgi:hypothetical protein
MRPLALLCLSLAACGAPFTMADPSATTGDDASPILMALAPDAPIVAADGGETEASRVDVANDGAPDASDPPRRDGGLRVDASPDADPPDTGPDAPDAPWDRDAAPDSPTTVLVHCSWGPTLTCPACNPGAASNPCCLVTGACGCTYGGGPGACQ